MQDVTSAISKETISEITWFIITIVHFSLKEIQ
jgi:hypothetical protein